MAAALAFAAYYVNWTWPFLSESVPQLLARVRRAVERERGRAGARVGLPPSRTSSPTRSARSWCRVLGIAGLVAARRGVERVLLLAWATVLPVFTGLDLFFNFLLKHHYFTMVPVAVGGGVLLARSGPARPRGPRRGRWPRS